MNEREEKDLLAVIELLGGLHDDLPDSPRWERYGQMTVMIRELLAEVQGDISPASQQKPKTWLERSQR